MTVLVSFGMPCAAADAATAPIPVMSNAELRTRIAHLEQELEVLKAAVPQARNDAPAASSLEQGRVAVVPTFALSAKQYPGMDTRFSIGGFIKIDAMETHTTDGPLADQATARDVYTPGTIPVGGNHPETYNNTHAKFSRLYIGADTVTDGGQRAGGYLEWDFSGNSLGSPNATNTYGLTVRQAYMYWGPWLAGQTWSNFMDAQALPDAVDLLGPADGAIFVRQAQLRYTHGGLSVSMENPHTTLTPYQGGSTINSVDHSRFPDLVTRYRWNTGFGFIGVAAMARQISTEPAATVGTSYRSRSKQGTAVSTMGMVKFGQADDLRFAASYGNVIGRYLGYAGIASDALVDSQGDIHLRYLWASYAAWHHQFTPELRANLVYSRNGIDNDVHYTGGLVTRTTSSGRMNVIYSPLPIIDVGLEYMQGRRELEDDERGTERRLQLTGKYAF